MEEKTYEVRIKCGNCRYGGLIGMGHEIGKGTTVKGYCKKTPCPECGCFTLDRHWI